MLCTEGERFLHSMLTIFMNHTFKSTMKLIEWCIQKEVDTTSRVAASCCMRV